MILSCSFKSGRVFYNRSLKGFQMRLRDFKRKTVILFMSDNMHSNGVNISLRYTKKLYIRFAFFRNTIIENCGKTPTVNLLPSPV